MNKISFLLFLIIVNTLIALPLTLTPANAETSGWIRDSNLKAYMDKLGKRGLYPTKITCADDGARTDSSIMHVKARVTSKKQGKPGVSWTWGIQTNTNKAERELKAKGFSLASKSTAASPNGGLRVKCVIFHR